MKLAIAQMVLGVLIIVDYAWNVWAIPQLSLVWHFPTVAYHLPLGLAVLGCGIAQFLKARG